MPLGGLAPLPLRLGDDYHAADHMRVASDLAAAKRSCSLAVFAYTLSSGTVTLHSYTGRNGAGSGHAPTATVNGTGDVTWTFDTTWSDDYGHTAPLNITHALSGSGSTGTRSYVHSTTANTVRVVTNGIASKAAADSRVLVKVYGGSVGRGTFKAPHPGVVRTPTGTPAWSVDVDIGDYGSGLDKTDSITEGHIPYASIWYDQLTATLGSAFTSVRSGYMHAFKAAVARSSAALTRAGEKLKANSRPHTADEALAEWVDALRVPVRADDQPWQIRQRCAARFKLAVGPTIDNVESAVSALLGDAFVRTWTTVGSTLATPPSPTFWPTANPGPTAWDLGNGTWLSARAHFVVEVTQPSWMPTSDYLRLINVDLFDLLNRMLPMWMTFNAAENLSAGGFTLDVSKLDFGGLG